MPILHFLIGVSNHKIGDFLELKDIEVKPMEQIQFK